MSWFPAPEQQDKIQFVFMKSWSYPKRMAMIILLLMTGMAIQLLANYWVGLIFLFSGTLLGIIKGYQAKPKMQGAEIWNRVTPDEFQKVIRKEKQLISWDRDAFDISNKLGCSILFVFIFAFIVIFGVVTHWVSFYLARYICINGAVVFIPHWFTGVRNYLKRDKLILKIQLLQKIMKSLESNSEIQVHPMLSVQKTKKDKQVPKDVRLMIRLIQAPEDLMGIQVQIAINTVQGTDYPYLYCVLLAKDKAQLFDRKAAKVSHDPKVVFSKSHSDGVDVLVVRQQTSKNSGYETNEKAAIHVIECALALARELLD